MSVSDTKKYEIINNIFIGMDDQLSGYFAKPIIFQGIMSISPILLDKVLGRCDNNLSYDSFYNTLECIKDNIKINDIKKYGKSYKQFGEKILNTTTRRRSIPIDIAT